MISAAAASWRLRDEVDRLGELARSAAADSEHVELLEGEIADPERRVGRPTGRRRGRARPTPRARRRLARAPGTPVASTTTSGPSAPAQARVRSTRSSSPATAMVSAPIVCSDARGGSRVGRRGAPRRRGRARPARRPARSGRRRRRRHALPRATRPRTTVRIAIDTGSIRAATAGLLVSDREHLGGGEDELLLQGAVAVDPDQVDARAGVVPSDPARIALSAGGDRPERDALAAAEVRPGSPARSPRGSLPPRAPGPAGRARSCPRTCPGRRGSSGSPSRTTRRPPARTSTSPGPGPRGSGTSTTSISPWARVTAARMALTPRGGSNHSASVRRNGPRAGRAEERRCVRCSPDQWRPKRRSSRHA